jgi:hypothetical protein
MDAQEDSGGFIRLPHHEHLALTLLYLRSSDSWKRSF